MTIAVNLRRMQPADALPRAGSHCSDGMQVDTGWHFHDMHQLLYAFEGAIEVESARGRHLIPRQLAAWIPAGALHRTIIQGERSGSVFFPATMVSAAGEYIRTVLVSTLMREMIREAMRWPINEALHATGATFFNAMATLCSEWIEHDTGLFLPTSGNQQIKRALEYTAQQLTTTLTDVCSHVGMSERSLRRHLNDEIGMTWEAYRRRSRLLNAVTLLSESDTAVSEVAATCGFESPSAFAKAFRLAMNESPRAYRKRVRS